MSAFKNWVKQGHVPSKLDPELFDVTSRRPGPTRQKSMVRLAHAKPTVAPLVGIEGLPSRGHRGVAGGVLIARRRRHQFGWFGLCLALKAGQMPPNVALRFE